VRIILFAFFLTLLQGQNTVEAPVLDFVCPMDPDVRAAVPGQCPRCGMKLKTGVPDAIEYPVQLVLHPRAVRPNQPVELSFHIRDPRDGKPVKEFELVHEKLFHLFAVSEDLSFFMHEHPVLAADQSFRYKAVFPKPGLYRLLSDFYPKGGTPQLIERTVMVTGAAPMRTPLSADLAPKQAENIEVELVTEPAVPIAGMKTLLFFRVKPSDGLEPYLGAWGHMLAVSDDLVDTIHNHPFLADGGPQVQFNQIFPRARTYKVWAQFQRDGMVNTVAFTIPVSELK
jgi:Heavy metal binding domain